MRLRAQNCDGRTKRFSVLCFSSSPQDEVIANATLVELPSTITPYERNLWLRDLAVWCGASVLDESSRLVPEMLGRAGQAQSVGDEILIYDSEHSEAAVHERLENYTMRIDGHEVIDSKIRIQQHVSAIGSPYVELKCYSPGESELAQLEHAAYAAMLAARSCNPAFELSCVADRFCDCGNGSIGRTAMALDHAFGCIAECIGGGHIVQTPTDERLQFM